MEASRPLQGSRRDHAGDLARGLRLGLLALTLALIGAAVAPAAAPAAAGVTVILPGDGSATIPASALGVQAPGTVGEQCALRARPGEEPGPSNHHGLPVAEALERYAEVRLPFGYLTVPRPNGTVAYLPGEWFEEELEGHTPFEGCEHALFSVDSEVTTRFFRPPLAGDPEDTNAEDNIATGIGEALTVGVHEGAILEVTVTPSTTDATAGSPVQFSASVPGGDGTYAWSFGDGATASGETASHSFAGSGTYEVRATATAGESGGESAPVQIVVGDPPTTPQPGATTAPSTKLPPSGPPGKGRNGRGGRSAKPGPGGAHGGRDTNPRQGGPQNQRSESAPRHPAPQSPIPSKARPPTSRPLQHRPPATTPSPPSVPTAPEVAGPGAQESSGGASPERPRCCSAEAPPEGSPRKPPEESPRSPEGRQVEGRLVGDVLGPTATITEALGNSSGQGSSSAAGTTDGDGGIAVPVGALVVVGLFGAGALFEARRGRAFR